MHTITYPNLSLQSVHLEWFTNSVPHYILKCVVIFRQQVLLLADVLQDASALMDKFYTTEYVLTQ